MTTRIFGLVLAGGQSRRMGSQDKTLMTLGDMPLVVRALDRLSPQADALAINTNGSEADFNAFGYPILRDDLPGYQGPLAGVLTGLNYAKAHGFTHVVTVAADTPFFPQNLVEVLIQSLPAEIVLATSNARRHPTFGLWSVEIASSLHHFLDMGDDRRIMKFVQNCDMRLAAFDMSERGLDPFFNINEPADFQQAERWLEGGPGA